MGSDVTVDHGTPMLGEPLPIELANATYAVRGHLQDGLRTTQQLSSWLRRVQPRLATPLTDQALQALDDTQLAMARDLRDCVRSLAQAVVDGLAPDPAALDRLNRYARTAPRWRELRWDPQPHTETRSGAPAVTAAVCEIAQAAVDLFAGPHRTDIRPCRAPGCVLYFLRDHPRREWCSVACGNRVRAARHYRRTRRPAGSTPNASTSPSVSV